MSKKNKEEEQGKDPRDNLRIVLEEIEQQGSEIAAIGRELTRSGQFTVDFARAARETMPYLRPNVDIEYFLDDALIHRDQGSAVLRSLYEIHPTTYSSTASTTYVSSSGIFTPPNLYLEADPTPQSLLNRLYLPQKRSSEASNVEKLLIDLGFDRAPEGKKSALEQFQIAHQAYEIPVAEGNPISTSLVPLRECINLVIGELLKLRPEQAPAKNEEAKIRSVGKQLKRDEIPADTVISWSKQWWELANQDLGGSKQQDITREEWGRRLMRGTVFLSALMSGLDRSKMKKK